MDALEALRDDGLHAEERGAFCGPVARAAGAVFLAGENHQRCFRLRVFHRGVVDGHLRAVVHRHAPFGTGAHEVFDPHIRESAARHDAIVASAAAVAVEILKRDAGFREEFSGG